jgi:hypothetical protein
LCNAGDRDLHTSRFGLGRSTEPPMKRFCLHTSATIINRLYNLNKLKIHCTVYKLKRSRLIKNRRDNRKNLKTYTRFSLRNIIRTSEESNQTSTSDGGSCFFVLYIPPLWCNRPLRHSLRYSFGPATRSKIREKLTVIYLVTRSPPLFDTRILITKVPCQWAPPKAIQM